MTQVDPRSSTVASPDEESAQWVRDLAAPGPARDEAIARLHALLLRIARSELGRRSGLLDVTGPELDDLAHQATDDALLAILTKVADFRAEGRFTTWAYRFVVLEVSSKLGRHFWQRPTALLSPQAWDQLPDRFSVDPAAQAELQELTSAVRDAVERDLSERQRQVFVSIVVRGIPMDALAVQLGSTRNAIYKTMFDARRTVRAALVAAGHLRPAAPVQKAGTSGWLTVDRFLTTDPHDIGCDEALRALHVFVELSLADPDQATARHRGVAAHLRACGPCEQDFHGLLIAAGVGS